MFKAYHAVFDAILLCWNPDQKFVKMISWIKENSGTNGTDNSLEYLFFFKCIDYTKMDIYFCIYRNDSRMLRFSNYARNVIERNGVGENTWIKVYTIE